MTDDFVTRAAASRTPLTSHGYIVTTTPGRRQRRALEVVLAAYASMTSGAPVTLSPEV